MNNKPYHPPVPTINKKPKPPSSTINKKPTYPSSTAANKPKYRHPVPSTAPKATVHKSVPSSSATPNNQAGNSSGPSMTGALIGILGKTVKYFALGVVETINLAAVAIVTYEERQQKLANFFACYYSAVERKKQLIRTTETEVVYPGTLYFEDNQIVFSLESALPPRIQSQTRKRPLLPPWLTKWSTKDKGYANPTPIKTYSWSRGGANKNEMGYAGQKQVKIPMRDVLDIKTVKAGFLANMSIMITTYAGEDYIFSGFNDYLTGLDHLQSLLRYYRESLR